ncbi:MAG: hypothetical protein ACREFH_16915 [Stellaceae bacterium]
MLSKNLARVGAAEIELTAEMIRAGGIELFGFDPREETPNEAAIRVFTSMIEEAGFRASLNNVKAGVIFSRKLVRHVDLSS